MVLGLYTRLHHATDCEQTQHAHVPHAPKLCCILPPCLPCLLLWCAVVRRDADAARVLRDVYRLGSSYSSAPSGLVDLGDITISRLGSKLTIMRDLKVGRHSRRAV